MNHTLLDVQCWVKGEVPHDPARLLNGQESLLPGLVLALQALHFLWLLFSWTCKLESIYKDKVQAMLAWVGEHGYDPRDLNRRFDLELRGLAIARACCGTMPNLVKKQSDYSGLPFRYKVPERGSLSPFEMVSTLAQCNVPLATARRLASIYELAAMKVDWVERIYLRCRPETFDMIKKRGWEVPHDRPYKSEEVEKEWISKTISRIPRSTTDRRESFVDTTVQCQLGGSPAAVDARTANIGLGISLAQAYKEEWLARRTTSRSLSSSLLSEEDTITMEGSPTFVDSESPSSQLDSGPHTPHRRLLEERLLATINDDRCSPEMQDRAPFRYSTECYPFELSNKGRREPIESRER